MAKKNKSWRDIGNPAARQAAKANYDDAVGKANIGTQSTAAITGAGTAPSPSQDIRSLAGRSTGANYSTPAASYDRALTRLTGGGVGNRTSTARLTGVNNAVGVNQAAYAPKNPLARTNPFETPNPFARPNPFAGALGAFGIKQPEKQSSSPSLLSGPGSDAYRNIYYNTQNKTLEERYQDYLNSARNQELGYTTPYFPPIPTTTTGGGGGGYGGGGYGRGRGGGGRGGYGGGYSPANYDKWLRSLTARWSF